MEDSSKEPRLLAASPPLNYKPSLFEELKICGCITWNYVFFSLIPPIFLYILVSFFRWVLIGEWIYALVFAGSLGAYYFLGGYKPYHLDGHGRPWPRLQQSKLYKYSAKYFPIHLIKTAEVKPDGKYIFGVHPHSVIPSYLTIGMMTQGCEFNKLYPGIELRGLAASSNFVTPLWKDIYLSVGYIDAGYPTAMSALKKGYSLTVLPGGEQEMLLAKPGDDTIVLKNRKGFVKLALEGGATLVPVYAFGANDTYTEYTWSKRINSYLSKKFRIVIPIFYGRWMTLYPYRKPVYLVVGAPLHVERKQTGPPTEEEVDHLHERYMVALQELFDTYKKQFGYEDRTLNVIEAVVHRHTSSKGKHSNNDSDNNNKDKKKNE